MNTRDDDVEESKGTLGIWACRRQPVLPEIGQWTEIQKMAQTLCGSQAPETYLMLLTDSPDITTPQAAFFHIPENLLCSLQSWDSSSCLHPPHTHPRKPCLHFHPTLFKDRLPGESLCLYSWPLLMLPSMDVVLPIFLYWYQYPVMSCRIYILASHMYRTSPKPINTFCETCPRHPLRPLLWYFYSLFHFPHYITFSKSLWYLNPDPNTW